MLQNFQTDTIDRDLEGSGNESARSSEPASELLETRQIARDFQVPGGTIRVETRIKVNRSPWTVRSIVLENGVEVQEGPFGPIQEELNPAQTEAEDRGALRMAFARQALVGHEARCRQIEKAIHGKPADGKGAGKGVAVVATLVVILAVIGGAAYFLGPGKRTFSKRADTVSEAGVASSTEPGAGPSAQQVPGEQSGAARQSEGTTVPTPLTIAPPVLRPAPRTGAGPRASAPTRPSGHTGSQPTQQARATPRPERKTDFLHVVGPSNYTVGPLRAGAGAFVDEPSTFSEVPAAFRDARCIRTANADRTQEVHVSFQVGRESRLYVGHDQRIRKKPEWLRSFSKTGQEWTIADGGSEVKFDVFARDVAEGPVVLGANTEWSGFTKRLRGRFPKDLKMYIVCAQAR